MKTDWQALVKRLIDEHGMTQQGIADYVGRTQMWVSTILSGHTKDPKYSDGVRLLNLERRLRRGRQNTEIHPGA